MKCILFLSIVVAACAASVIKDVREVDSLFFKHGDNKNDLHLEQTDVKSIARDGEDNEYILYTRLNSHLSTGQKIQIGNPHSLASSNFRPLNTIVFLVHGHNGDGEEDMVVKLTEAFLQDAEVNVIVVDWRRVANRIYISAKNGVPDVGRHMGIFINWLVATSITNFDRMHLVGFGLGAHVVGYAGREVNGQVSRITGLEPSGQLWGRDSGRLTYTDAQYVEVIHTNKVFFGIEDPIGDADFYPNGGDGQPGCWTNSCSHHRVVDLMAATITYNHLLASECETLRDVRRDRCSGPLSPMGNSDLRKKRSGIFRVNTGRFYPFA